MQQQYFLIHVCMEKKIKNETFKNEFIVFRNVQFAEKDFRKFWDLWDKISTNWDDMAIKFTSKVIDVAIRKI